MLRNRLKVWLLQLRTVRSSALAQRPRDQLVKLGMKVAVGGEEFALLDHPVLPAIVGDEATRLAH